MSGRPAGMSDDEEDEDEFEFSTINETIYSTNDYSEKRPETQENLFYTALKEAELSTMKAMLSNGFQVDQPLVGDWSPLMYACSMGSLPLIEFLIEEGANVNFNKDLFTPLMALCKCNSINEFDLLKGLNLLLKRGANINITDKHGSTALMYACSSRHVELVKSLVDFKCDVNIQDAEGWSALFHAVNEGQEDIIQVLIEGKARVDLIDRRRRSAFDLAIQKGYDHLGKLVCSKKERRRLMKEENEDSSVLDEREKDPVKALLAQLPSVNAKSISGFSDDVGKLLWAMGLGHFNKTFSANNVQLNEFLLITNGRLEELGVRFSVHRERILTSIRKFHLHQWNKASLGLKPRNQQMHIEDGIKLMCNVTKHLHILNATINYLRIHQPIPIKSDVFKMSENAIHQLNLISSELRVIQAFATNLKLKEKIEPVDLIKPRTQPRTYFFPFLITTGLISFVIWKKDLYVLKPFELFNFK